MVNEEANASPRTVVRVAIGAARCSSSTRIEDTESEWHLVVEAMR